MYRYWYVVNGRFPFHLFFRIFKQKRGALRRSKSEPVMRL